VLDDTNLNATNLNDTELNDIELSNIGPNKKRKKGPPKNSAKRRYRDILSTLLESRILSKKLVSSGTNFYT
jgi:hypothetical protein